MSKLEFLELLRELVRDAVTVGRSDPDDWSGLHTQYLVDQEQFMKNIETAIEREKGS